MSSSVRSGARGTGAGAGAGAGAVDAATAVGAAAGERGGASDVHSPEEHSPELELASTARRAPFHPSAAGVLRVLLERGLLERVFGFIGDRPPRLTFITDIA